MPTSPAAAPLRQAIAAAQEAGAGKAAVDALRRALDKDKLDARLLAAQRYGKQAHLQVRRALLKQMRAVSFLRKYASPDVADLVLLAVFLPGLVSLALLPVRLVRYCLCGRRRRGSRGSGGKRGRGLSPPPVVPEAVKGKSAALRGQRQGSSSAAVGAAPGAKGAPGGRGAGGSGRAG